MVQKINKEELLNMRVTSKFKSKVKKRAKDRKISISEYIRRLVHADEIGVIDWEARDRVLDENLWPDGS